MHLITRQNLADIAATRWKQTYCNSEGTWLTSYRIQNVERNPEAIYTKLVALGKEPDPDKVDEIIGNNGWTHVTCCECREEDGYRSEPPPDGWAEKPTMPVVMLGEDTTICMECMTKANALWYQYMIDVLKAQREAYIAAKANPG